MVHTSSYNMKLTMKTWQSNFTADTESQIFSTNAAYTSHRNANFGCLPVQLHPVRFTVFESRFDISVGGWW
jgi:hypothetical protein